jgi:hypothetical protein
LDQNLIARRFIVLARKLRDDVRKLLPSLGSDLHEIKNAVQSIDKNARAYQEKEQAKPEVIAILHEPEATQAERHTTNTHTQRRDRIRLLVEWLTFFAVLFYGLVAYQQWKEMIVATDAAQRAVDETRLNRIQSDKSLTATIAQFHQDQRAWVSVNSVELTTPWSDTTVGTITVSVSNSGKTPAINARITKLSIKPFPVSKDPYPLMNIAPQSSNDSFYIPVLPGTDKKANIRFVIEYWDVFQKLSDPPHTTSFCGYYPVVRIAQTGNHFLNDIGCRTPT